MKRLSGHALIKAVGTVEWADEGVGEGSNEIYLFAVTLKESSPWRADDTASENFRPASASIRKLFCRILSPKGTGTGRETSRELESEGVTERELAKLLNNCAEHLALTHAANASYAPDNVASRASGARAYVVRISHALSSLAPLEWMS